MEAVQNHDSLFVDWLTVWQVHSEHPPLNSGAVLTFNKQGAILFERMRSASIRGSHSTSVTVKSDGRSVVMSGNVGRFNRSDNLFNLDPRKTLQRANDLATLAGVPFFSAQDSGAFAYNRVLSIVPDSSLSELRTQPESSLHLSRVDLTRNYSCGSISNARHLVRDIARKSIARAKKGAGGDESVWFSNSRYMLKFYVKALEMAAHGDTESEAYHYALRHGIVRCEIELKRRLLNDLGWSDYAEFLKGWDMGNVHKLFDEYSAPLMNSKGISSPAVFVDSLPQRLRPAASAFLAGLDVRTMYSRATLYRYRKALLEYGLDILDDSPAQITTIVREVVIQPVTAPDWYWKEAA